MTKISTEQNTPLPSLSIDWDLYGSMLEDSDLSEAQKIMMIETLWSVVLAFVDLGFGIHPLQQVCGEDQDNITKALADMISCSHANDIIEKNTVPDTRGTHEGSLS